MLRTEKRSSKSISSKLLDANIECALDKLGEQIIPSDGQVKGVVMRTLNDGINPKFSRMSGIQEWQNCVCLFVNIGGPEYNNVWLGGGAAITWFAQSRQDIESQVLQRLIASGKQLEGGYTCEENDFKTSSISEEAAERIQVKLERLAGSMVKKQEQRDLTTITRSAAKRIQVKLEWQLTTESDVEKYSKEASPKRERDASDCSVNSLGKSDNVVLLFCRLHKSLHPTKTNPSVNSSKQKRKNEDSACISYQDAYICCGRLQYLEHDATVSPISFVFKLMDYDVLQHRTHFKYLL